MFTVKNKETEMLYRVYAVKEDTNGITRFLLFKNNKWVWEISGLFEPYTSVFRDIPLTYLNSME